MKAVVFGDMIWDCFPEGSVIGGAQFNFAANLAHLDNETYFISAIGTDELGKPALEACRKHGIKTDFIQENGFPTGACIVSLDEKGIPTFNVLQNTAYDNIVADDEMIRKLNELKPDMISFNTLIQRTPVSKKSIIRILDECEFKEIFCDVNLRKDCFDEDSLRRCLTLSTTLKVSDEEGHFLYDLGLVKDRSIPLPYAIAKEYPNIKTVIYTLGAKGSEALDTKSGVLYESGIPKKVDVVSTVGAGDCYGATFISVMMNGGTIPEAIKLATERSSIVVASKEAVPF